VNGGQTADGRRQTAEVFWLAPAASRTVDAPAALDLAQASSQNGWDQAMRPAASLASARTHRIFPGGR
jgi:hypothetical protein